MRCDGLGMLKVRLRFLDKHTDDNSFDLFSRPQLALKLETSA